MNPYRVKHVSEFPFTRLAILMPNLPSMLQFASLLRASVGPPCRPICSPSPCAQDGMLAYHPFTSMTLSVSVLHARMNDPIAAPLLVLCSLTARGRLGDSRAWQGMVDLRLAT